MTVHLPSSPSHLGILLIVAGLFGLMVGSFVNVVVYRAPRRLSVNRPRSFCPTCQRQLTATDNIPIVSWLALRGRCRSCGEPISVRYPLVEAGTAAAFVLVTLAWRGSAPAVGYCVLGATLVSVLLIDAGTLRAPLAVAAIGAVVGDLVLVAGAIWSHQWTTLWGAQIGVVVGAAGFAALRRIDPDCRQPWQFGRSALVPACCWLGGLGVLPAAFGFGFGGLAFMAWAALSIRVGRRSASTRLGGLPMVVAIAVGTAVGLLVLGR
jgi:leader peptidase (prepilin peptidase)/N-methyltransferase